MIFRSVNAIWCFFGLYISLVSCERVIWDEDVSIELASLKKEQLDFNIHVKPILSDKCFACHGPDKAKQKAGLALHEPVLAYSESINSKGQFAIVPGKLSQSEMIKRILSPDQEEVMPPVASHLSLSPREKAVLIKWIEEGAEYKKHWAFQSPKEYEVPLLPKAYQYVNEIDQFVMDKQIENGLTPSLEAEKDVLLRRIYLDLTGLSPTSDEIKDFVDDTSSNAYEKVVDRLMASNHFGERMATDWMDVARFSDSYGYQVDRLRDMSPWRDWVISAFNNNMRYDDFITQQLAGDLLPHPTKDQVLATGFGRLHPQNMEDGIIGEEFRVENVSDRIAVLGDGILGLTLSCAKCHDHKFDPISQKNYFELFAFFNTMNENGQIAWDTSVPVPTLELPTQAQSEFLGSQLKKIETIEKELEGIGAQESEAIKKWIKKQSDIPRFQTPTFGLVANYTLDGNLTNEVERTNKAFMNREFSLSESAEYVEGLTGEGILLNGDNWLECKDVGIFKRSDPFAISIWMKIPSNLTEGVIFHKNKGTMLHSLRGYHLKYESGHLEWIMARTYPENAIVLRTSEKIPSEDWVHIVLSYDGSSHAKGTKLFVNGKEASLEIIKDNLTRDIVFNHLEDIIYPEPLEPPLKVGGQWRGKGLTGAKIDELMVYNRALGALEASVLYKENRGDQVEFNLEPADLEEFYLNNYSSSYQNLLLELKNNRQLFVDAAEEVKEVMVMREMDQPRKTYILNRGVYDDYGHEVKPSTPESILAFPDSLSSDRLGLAKWLFLPDHPLTSRVIVNRYWQMFFGNGLVKTSQDFGNQGSFPTHLELLDWLSLNFMERGWDIKWLVKNIVMSSTYRQKSEADMERKTLDPDNSWLSYGPRQRMTSEMIRDHALKVSGLLKLKIGGPSVFPYQPDGLWSLNFDPYSQGTGDELYRRSLYSIWRRTNPNPTLAIFDQPERNLCTVKRQQTSTPLQALVLLNDPTFLEACKILGEEMTRFESREKAVEEIYLRIIGQTPQEKEVERLLKIRDEERAVFRENKQKFEGWSKSGAYELDGSVDPTLVAANSVVASIILNSAYATIKR